jgi:hypothetical protein
MRGQRLGQVLRLERASLPSHRVSLIRVHRTRRRAVSCGAACSGATRRGWLLRLVLPPPARHLVSAAPAFHAKRQPALAADLRRPGCWARVWLAACQGLS